MHPIPTKTRSAWTRLLLAATLVALVGVPLLMPPAAAAGLGTVEGDRVQAVASDLRETDTVTVNCVGFCILTWESLGPSVLTLRCLDDGETTTSVFGQSLPRLSHPCIVESTLEIGGATESVLLWRAGKCTDPACTPWP